MRRNKRRSGRGRVIIVGIVLVGFVAAGAWLFFGKEYFRLRQAQATPAAAKPAADLAGPRVIAAADDESSGEKPVLASAGQPKPGVPTLDQLAGKANDEPLKPRTGSTGADVTPDGSTPAGAAPDAGDAKPEPPRPGALKPVAPPEPAEQKSSGEKNASEKEAAAEQPSGNANIAAALKLYTTGKIVEARHELNALLAQSLSRADEAEARRQLAKIADDSIFTRRAVPADPLADSYTVRSGDRLVNISRDYKVPAEILMYVNGIKDATKIRAEQKLKVLRGPFHVRISKSQFRMDVYLQDLYIRSYRVGLGADQGTPEGVWKVKERLENPTYYPPASSDKKRIIPPDDPENPLGNHWIGLEGVSGDAVGHTGYGIHGTIEPESIGRAVSLGCVRMLNEDVEFLYKLMLPGESTVTVLP